MAFKNVLTSRGESVIDSEASPHSPLFSERHCSRLCPQKFGKQAGNRAFDGTSRLSLRGVQWPEQAPSRSSRPSSVNENSDVSVNSDSDRSAAVESRPPWGTFTGQGTGGLVGHVSFDHEKNHRIARDWIWLALLGSNFWMLIERWDINLLFKAQRRVNFPGSRTHTESGPCVVFDVTPRCDFSFSFLGEPRIRSPLEHVLIAFTRQEAMSPKERAVLDAHRINAGPSRFVRLQLEQARRWRRRPLAWIAPGWRKYLDVLIERFENELAARGQG